MKENNKLLPCPFCGKEARVNYIGVCERPYFVECVDGNCIAGDCGISFRTENEAIEAWNRRECQSAYL